MKKTRKRYSEQDRSLAVAMVNNGRAVQEVSRELDIEISCLYEWVRRARPEAGPTATTPAREGLEPELARLRNEVQLLQRENLVLKKAAVILGRESLGLSAR